MPLPQPQRMPLPQPPPPPPPPPVTLVGSDSGTFGEFAQVTSAEDSVRDLHKVSVRTTHKAITFTPIGPGPGPLALGQVMLVSEDVFKRKWELSYAEAATMDHLHDPLFMSHVCSHGQLRDMLFMNCDVKYLFCAAHLKCTRSVAIFDQPCRL